MIRAKLFLSKSHQNDFKIGHVNNPKNSGS
jgi:hypothetical protein